jgi:hypothetical protein
MRPDLRAGRVLAGRRRWPGALRLARPAVRTLPAPPRMPLSSHPPRGLGPPAVHPHMHAAFWAVVGLACAVVAVYGVLFLAFVAQHKAGRDQRSGRDGRLARLTGRRLYVQHMRLLFWLSAWPRLARWLAATVQQQAPPELPASKEGGDVVVVGDSPIAQHWRGLTEDFHPLPIRSCPFGNRLDGPTSGLWTPEWLHALVSAKPGVIVYCAGDADISSGAAPQTVLNNFRAFVQAFRGASNEVAIPIVYLSILASPFQRGIGPPRMLRICAANSGPWGYAKTAAESDPTILCVDLNSCSFVAKPKYFLQDGFHLNLGGDRHFATVLRPLLTAVLAGNIPQARITSFFGDFGDKQLIILPRQARDKHRVSTQSNRRFLAAG